MGGPHTNRLTKFVGSVPFATMLVVMLALGLAPTLLLGKLFVEQSLKDVRFAQRELHGLAYLRPSWSAYQLSAAHRAGAHVAPDVIARLRAEAEAKDGLFDTAAASRQVLESIARTSSLADMARLRRATDGLITRIGDQSNLILDPDLDTYYLMDVTLLKARALADAMDELGASAAGDDMARRDLARAMNQLRKSVRLAIEGNPDKSIERGVVPRRLATLDQAAQAYLAHPSRPAWQALDEAHLHFWEAAANDLDRLLRARVDRLMRNLYVNLAFSIALLASVLGLAWLLIRTLSGAVWQLTRRIVALSERDFDSAVPGVEMRNEIGIIARALNDLAAVAKERQLLEARLAAESEQASRELAATVRRVEAENAELLARIMEQQRAARESERRAVASLARDLEAQITGLVGTARSAVQQLNSTAMIMANDARTSQSRSALATSAAHEIRDAVNSVAPTIIEIAGQLKRLRGQSEEGRVIAESAIARVDATNARMAEFEAATDRIDSMQSMIASVARKTNLLALNASIEAARAGELGRGFMVVAGEVKALANSTREATADIATEIAEIRKCNRSVVTAFQQLVDQIRRLSDSSRAISGGIADQSSRVLSLEQAIAVADSKIAELSASIEEADRAAATASGSARGIAKTLGAVGGQLETLDGAIAQFTSGVQSAQTSEAAGDAEPVRPPRLAAMGMSRR